MSAEDIAVEVYIFIDIVYVLGHLNGISLKKPPYSSHK